MAACAVCPQGGPCPRSLALCELGLAGMPSPPTCPRQRALASADSPWMRGPTVQAPGPGSAFRPWLLGVCLLRPSPTPSPSPSWPLSRQCAPSSHDTPQRAWPPPEMSCAPGVPRPWVPPGSGRSRPQPPPEQEAVAASQLHTALETEMGRGGGGWRVPLFTHREPPVGPQIPAQGPSVRGLRTHRAGAYSCLS